MNNKIVLITGCNGGIGSALVEKYKKKQWYILGVDITQNYNDKMIDMFFNVDLSNESSIKDMFQVISDKIGKIDCIINNAAYSVCKSILETDINDFKKTLDVNLVAPFLFLKYGFNLLTKHNSSIINIGSVHSITTSDKIAAYACSKAGIVGLTKNMALEMAQYGIRVNAISPGAIDTNMLRDGLKRGHIDGSDDDELVNNLGKKCPIGRVGYPFEIAEMAYFLSNNKKSGNITGTNIFVDGGATIKLSTE